MGVKMMHLVYAVQIVDDGASRSNIKIFDRLDEHDTPSPPPLSPSMASHNGSEVNSIKPLLS